MKLIKNLFDYDSNNNYKTIKNNEDYSCSENLNFQIFHHIN